MVYLGIIGNQGDNMLLNIKGSNKATRTLVDRAAWWYAERLMGKRLILALEDGIVLDSEIEGVNLSIWEDEGITFEVRRSWHLRSDMTMLLLVA